MKSEEFYKHVDENMEKRGIEKYSIKSLEITERNFSVNQNGELESVVYIDVCVIPETKVEQIEIKINIVNK